MFSFITTTQRTNSFSTRFETDQNSRIYLKKKRFSIYSNQDIRLYIKYIQCTAYILYYLLRMLNRYRCWFYVKSIHTRLCAISAHSLIFAVIGQLANICKIVFFSRCSNINSNCLSFSIFMFIFL